MPKPRKIVLHSVSGYGPGFDSLVAKWISDGVKYVGVIGVDASRIEDIVDDLCIGNGEAPYFMLTAAHGPEDSLDDAVYLARQISEVEGVRLDETIDVVRF